MNIRSRAFKQTLSFALLATVAFLCAGCVQGFHTDLADGKPSHLDPSVLASLNDASTNMAFSDDDLVNAVVQIATFEGSREIADAALVSQIQSTINAVTAGSVTSDILMYKMASVASNEEIPGWSALNAIDGNGSTTYSSSGFAGAANDRGIYLEARLAGTSQVNELVITPRLLNGQVMGFPLNYSIYLRTPDDSGWMSIGSYSIQPDFGGNLLIDLSRTYWTAGVRLVPNVVGVDNNGTHYFQISEIQLGFGAAHGESGLTCWIPGISASLPSVTRTMSGSTVSSTIGLTTELGGIGTNFGISHNGTALELLSPHSVGGAGWSTTYYTTAENGDAYSYNQGAGNEVQMWGFHTEMTDMTQTNWVPLYSDHLQPADDFNAAQHNTSPCAPQTNPVVHDAGQTAVTGAIATSSTGTQTVHWESQYSYMALQDEHFKYVNGDQALYLDRTVARQHKMRIYTIAKDHSWVKKINPVDMGPDFGSFPNQQEGGCGDINCATHTADLAYAVLVYEVGGEDVGIAIHKTNGDPLQAQINLETETGCEAPGPHCGIVNFHSWLDQNAWSRPAGDFIKGEIRRYSISYEIGTLDELKKLGYGIQP